MARLLALALLVCSASAFSVSRQHQRSASSALSGTRRSWFAEVGAAAGATALVAPAPALANLVYFPERSVELEAKRVRKMAGLLDDLEDDIQRRDWDFIVEYPGQFRIYAQAFTKYTDTAFPDNTDIDKSLRFAMRYEVGKLFGAVSKLKAAAAVKNLPGTQAAFADVSLAYDRYLKAGNLYEGDASKVGDAFADVPVKMRRKEGGAKPQVAAASNEAAAAKKPAAAGSKGLAARRSEAAAAAPVPTVPKDVTFTLQETPAVGDEVVVFTGPDTGKTGTLLGISDEGSSKKASGAAGSGYSKAIIKTGKVARGFREIIVIPVGSVAKRTFA